MGAACARGSRASGAVEVRESSRIPRRPTELAALGHVVGDNDDASPIELAPLLVWTH